MTISTQLSTLAIALSLALPACSQPAAAATSSEPTPVKLKTVERRHAAGATRYSGSLEPAIRVDMAFRVGGYVEALGEIDTPHGKRPIDKGDFVRKGSVLARVRAADYAEKLATLNAQVSEARASVRLTSEELGRNQRLFSSGAITQAALDTKQAQSESAVAQQAAALARANEASLALGDTVLRAPIDGVILSRQVEVGTLVAAGTPALSVADIRSVKAVFGAPQSLVEQLHLGSSVQVFVGAESEARAPEKLLAAQVTRIAPAADSSSRVFSIEAALPNPDASLRPGAVVSVHVPDAALDVDALVVPLAAVVRSPRDARGFAVFVFQGEGDRGPVRLREVQLGEVSGNAVSVTRGLALAERVVTVGSSLVRDGNEAVAIR